jgi:hypothetical protein
MNKKVISLLLLSALLTSPLTFANAAVKAGTTCKTAGLTSVVSGKTFTCIKSGKKLVWNKGVPVVVQPVFTPPKVPTDFKDLYEKRDGIAYAAWKLTSDNLSNGKSNVSNLIIHTGPNTTPKYKTPEMAINLVSKTFSSNKTPEQIYLVQYSSKDLDWAEEKVKSLLSTSDYDQLNRNENGHLVDSNCKPDCLGSKQVSTNSGVAFILQGVPLTNNGDPMGVARWQKGQLEAHEFVHAMQRATVTGQQSRSWPYTWIVEGGAELGQNLVMSNASYEEYLKWRKIDSSEFYGKDSLITKKYVEDYLSLDSDAAFFRAQSSYYSYNLGSRIMEIFVALKGPGVILDVYKLTYLNGFSDAFKSIFGIPWSEATPVIAAVIADQFQGTL